jgi:lipoprotein-anchoring transpeptidase ErfK/SrfK
VPRSFFRLLAAVAATAVLAVSCGSNDRPTLSEPPASISVDPALVGCDPRLDRYPYHVAYAKTEGELAIYDNPGDPVPSQTMTNPRLTDSEPPLEMPLAFLVKEEPTDDDCRWINVYLPVRPNGSTGWVKRDEVDVEAHTYRMEVYLSDFTFKAYEGERVILEAPIATARDNTPTPGGLYYTTELLRTDDPDGLYGPYAFGLSGFSDVLTSFNGGAGQLGIHGTNEPDKMGQQVSAGCIRLRNEDILELVDTFKVDIGIPVQVYA